MLKTVETDKDITVFQRLTQKSHHFDKKTSGAAKMATFLFQYTEYISTEHVHLFHDVCGTISRTTEIYETSVSWNAKKHLNIYDQSRIGRICLKWEKYRVFSHIHQDHLALGRYNLRVTKCRVIGHDCSLKTQQDM